MQAAGDLRQAERLAQLRQYEILDTPREEEFDEIVRLAADICEVPIAVLNFIEAERQWFKAEVGLGVRSTPLETSLCRHAITANDFVEIPDTLADPRTRDNPNCLAQNGFRFYAAALLMGENGLPVGTLCVLDRESRELTTVQRRTLVTLANRVMAELNLRLALRREKLLRREIDHRVRNSLASINAIVQLQTMSSRDEGIRGALDAVNSRISALAALHDDLHEGPEGRSVDFQRLVERAVTGLRKIVPSSVAIETDVPPAELSSAEAASIALLVNEFVTNSVKHGFGPNGGKIEIEGRAEGAGVWLRCRDDGSANEETIARLTGSNGLGTRVMHSLAGSMEAELRWSIRNPGLQLEITSRSQVSVAEDEQLVGG